MATAPPGGTTPGAAHMEDMQQADQQVGWLKQMIEQLKAAGVSMAQEITDEDWARFSHELAMGNGRDFNQLKADILKWRVGEENFRWFINHTLSQIPYSGDETPEQRAERVYQEIITGQRQVSEIITLASDAQKAAGVTQDDVQQPEGREGEGTEPGQAQGIMQGDGLTIVKIDVPGGENRWMVRYNIPGQPGMYAYYQFDSIDELNEALGAEWYKKYDYQTLTEQQFNQAERQGNYVFGGDAAQVIGATGTFENLWTSNQQQALLDAGIMDPTIQGQFLEDPEVQAIMAAAVAGNWTPERIRAELRQTEFYTETLYPGIEHFYSLGSQNPEQDWQQYFRTTSEALSAMGYDQSEHKALMDELLGAGVDDQLLIQFAGVYNRATANPEYFQAFNQWSQQMIGKALDFDTWFDFLEGTAQPELYEVAQAAMLQYQEDLTGIELTDEQIKRITAQTDLSEEVIGRTFQNLGQMLMQMDRSILVKKYGITRDDVVALAYGVSPASGKSLDELSRLGMKIMKEEKLLGQDKGTPFVGFTEQGRPQAQGLKGLAPEQ